MSIAKPSHAPLVGKKIRQLRKDRNLTQAELATRIGIQQSDLCRMETGEYKVSLETLFKILRIFDMNIGEFFHEEMQLPDSEPDRDAELLSQFHKLSPPRQGEVLDFVRYKAFQESSETVKGDS